MTCISPPELPDTDLLRYLDGEAESEVAVHLGECSHCRERAQHLSHLQGRLVAQLYRIRCPPPAEIGEYHLGLLPREQAAAVARHLGECALCSRELAHLRDYLGEPDASRETDPFEQVKVLVAQLIAGARDMLRPAQPVLAPAYAGLRGEEPGPTLYQAGDLRIAIEIQEDVEQQGRKVLLGLVTGVDSSDLQVQLWRGNQRVTQVSVDEWGNFVFPDLEPGRYELILSGPEIEIHVQELEVGTG